MPDLKHVALFFLLIASTLVNATQPSALPHISVSVPTSYATSNKSYPVLYVLDGTLNGELVTGMLNRMQNSGGANEHIIVGIDSQNRLRDFAPTINTDPRGPVGEGGGADAFLDYIESDLMPSINKQYRTNNHNVIAGHSIAGLLVIHAFHSRPSLFQGHLAFSPAVWWGNRETVKAAQHYVLDEIKVDTYLYINIGNEGGEMGGVFSEFKRVITRNRPLNLTLDAEHYSDEDHGLTMAAGLYSALRGLFRYQQRKGM